MAEERDGADEAAESATFSNGPAPGALTIEALHGAVAALAEAKAREKRELDELAARSPRVALAMKTGVLYVTHAEYEALQKAELLPSPVPIGAGFVLALPRSSFWRMEVVRCPPT